VINELDSLEGRSHGLTEWTLPQYFPGRTGVHHSLGWYLKHGCSLSGITKMSLTVSQGMAAVTAINLLCSGTW